MFCADGRKIIILVALAAMVGAISLSAFSLEPISQSFRPSGPESSRLFRLSNPSDRPIAVRLAVYTREIDPDGVESRTPAGSLFTIFPSQVIIEPQSRQNVRVRWTGPADLDRERSFRLLAEQVPVDFDGTGVPEGGSITIVIRYMAAVYVTPPGSTAEVRIRIDRIVHGGAGSELESDAESGVWIAAENIGTRHAILGDLQITLRDGESVVREYGPEDLAGLAGENLLAGTVRRYFLPMEAQAVSRVNTISFARSE